MTPRREVNVFVFLGHGFGASNWAARYARGMIPGINEALPYGYYLAAGEGWSINYSEDTRETQSVALFRRSLRKALGLDLIHALRNRQRLFESDIVWTHTEFEHLAVLTLLRCASRRRRPLVLANCIWLFDKWRRLSKRRQAVIRGLIKEADLVTSLCSAGVTAATELFPQVATKETAFGIKFADAVPRKARTTPGPIRVLAIGNDPDRDWPTLEKAVNGCANIELAIASHSNHAPKPSANISLTKAHTEQEILKLYDWADLVAVILKPNLHASGITTALEAVVRSAPVVATDTPGLRDYFDDEELHYVPVGDHDALREALHTLGHDSARRYRLTEASLHRSLASDYTSRGFAMRCKSASSALMGINANSIASEN